MLAPFGESSPSGIEEFQRTEDCGSCPPESDPKSLAVVGSSTGRFYVLCHARGLTDCQGIDPGADVLRWNGDDGGSDFIVEQRLSRTGVGFIGRPPGIGKYVIHWNFFRPTSGTITELPADLGPACFPFLIPPFGGGSPISVFNSLGKTAKLGSSNYFGTATANPRRAPAVWLWRIAGDPVNWTPGDEYTMQGIIMHTHPPATSTKGISVTNALAIQIE